MKKNGSKSYIILGILFVLVSVIAFAVPSVKTAAFWLYYDCIYCPDHDLESCF